MEPSIDYKFNVSCSQARNALHALSDFLSGSLLQIDGRNAWNSPQELKAVLGLQDLEDRHHHIPVVVVPRQSYWMNVSAQIIDKVSLLQQLYELNESPRLRTTPTRTETEFLCGE
jgi:hypothetical protein